MRRVDLTDYDCRSDNYDLLYPHSVQGKASIKLYVARDLTGVARKEALYRAIRQLRAVGATSTEFYLDRVWGHFDSARDAAKAYQDLMVDYWKARPDWQSGRVSIYCHRRDLKMNNLWRHFQHPVSGRQPAYNTTAPLV